MPVFAERFGYTPEEFKALTVADFRRLVRHLNDQAASAERARQQAKRGRGLGHG